MTRPEQQSLPSDDSLLVDYARRLAKFRSGRRAVHLFLSRLQPHHRRKHHLRVAASTFEPLVRKFDGAIFSLFNQDLVVVCNGARLADMDDCVLRVRYLFSDDPLLQGGEAEEDPFSTWFDLEKDYPAFLALAEANGTERRRHDEHQTAGEEADAGPAATALPALQPSQLSTLVGSIFNADLSGMLRRQPTCAVAGDRRPEVLFRELYFSIDGLRDTVMPGHDLKANRWLFRELTRHLDRRMITLLKASHDDVLNRAFSINLNVETLLTPEFLDFDAAINGAVRRTIVIELQLFDVVANIDEFLFARELLRDRGYRVCIDGVSPYALPVVDREALEVDLVKLEWGQALAEPLAAPHDTRLSEAIESLSSERLILSHCDSTAALAAGRALGINMYQGHLIDRLLRDGTGRQETVQALAEANARNRAANRALGRAS